MIDRMFIQEEKTTLALDKQLAKEKPGEGAQDAGRARCAPSSPCALSRRGGGRGLTLLGR